MDNQKVAKQLVKIAKELVGSKKTAAAGPYTLLVQLARDLKDNDGEIDLEKWGFAMGHTPCADYIVGAGVDIVRGLISLTIGSSSAAKDARVMKIIAKNIRQALKDNEIFKGLRADQSHEVWTEYMENDS